MKKYWLVSFVLVLCMAAASFGMDKAALYDAIEQYEAGVKVSYDQLQMMRQAGYDFNYTPVNHELDLMGGPDDYGYMYIDNEEVEGPDWAWVDITATGLLVEGLADDNYVGPYAMGIDFPFYGDTYTDIYIQSNGTLSFFDAYVSLSNYEMPYAGWIPYEAMIAWFWDDLNANNGGEVYIEAVDMGDQMACVIQYVEYHDYWPSTGYCDFEIIMYEDGTILMMYDYISDDMNVDSCTNGIQNAMADIGLTYVYNNDPVGYPYSGLAVMYYLDEPPPPPDAWVYGYVTDGDTGDPIEGADVTVGGYMTLTDVDGYYETPAMFYAGEEVICMAEAGGYHGADDVLLLGVGGNQWDAALEPINVEADILIWQGDSTPESSVPVIDVLHDLGYTTYETTDYAAVDWGNYDYVFAFLGIYPNYYPVLTDSPEEAVMVDYLNGGGCLYVEGGDVFGYNSPANLLEALNVADAADGSGDLGWVTGVMGTWTDGWYMQYIGENSWIDRLTPGEGAVTVLTNEDVVTPYICGMVNDAGDYKNACFTFELGMLVDGDMGTVYDMVAGLMDWYVAAPPPPPDLEITLYPMEDIPQVPYMGCLPFEMAVVNNTMDAMMFDGWITVTFPDGWVAAPQYYRAGDIHIDGDGVRDWYLELCAPQCALEGIYTLNAYVGMLPDMTVIDWDCFDFEVLPMDGIAQHNENDWTIYGWGEDVDGDFTAGNAVPTEFSISEVYPNPFNPTTSISIALPSAAEMTVNVFNVTGQQVAVLANGRFAEGYHSFTFDANSLSSGIYFIQATVPGKMNDMRKVMLVK